MSKFRCGLSLLVLLQRAVLVRLKLARPLDLVTFLEDPEREIRWYAAEFLASVGDKSIITPVFDSLQREPDPYVRQQLVWALEKCKAWDELYRCLDSPVRQVRTDAAAALSHSGQIRFVADLLQRLVEGNDQDYTHGSILSGIVDASSAAVLLEYLSRASSPPIRSDLLALLGATGDKRVFDRLVLALQDADERVRQGAVLGLMRLGDARATGAIQKLMLDPSESVRGSAKAALRHLGSR